MSVSSSSRQSRRRLWLVVLAVLIVTSGVAVWSALHTAEIPGLKVERVSIISPGEADGGRKPSGLATPTRIAVMFSTPESLEAIRTRLGVGYIAARLSSCRDPERETREVATQRAEYLVDHGRVTALPGNGPTVSYQAVFDDRLTKSEDHRFTTSSALAQDLCFALVGGSMWWGKAASETIPLEALAANRSND